MRSVPKEDRLTAWCYTGLQHRIMGQHVVAQIYFDRVDEFYKKAKKKPEFTKKEIYKRARAILKNCN